MKVRDSIEIQLGCNNEDGGITLKAKEDSAKNVKDILDMKLERQSGPSLFLTEKLKDL